MNAETETKKSALSAVANMAWWANNINSTTEELEQIKVAALMSIVSIRKCHIMAVDADSAVAALGMLAAEIVAVDTPEEYHALLGITSLLTSMHDEYYNG